MSKRKKPKSKKLVISWLCAIIISAITLTIMIIDFRHSGPGSTQITEWIKLKKIPGIKSNTQYNIGLKWRFVASHLFSKKMHYAYTLTGTNKHTRQVQTMTVVLTYLADEKRFLLRTVQDHTLPETEQILPVSEELTI